MKIFAPVKDFNGIRCNVRFVNGVGETDNSNAIAWFKIHGYKVAISEESNVETNEIADESEDEPDLEAMSAEELREWALDNDYNVRNTRSKEKLLEIIRG